MLHGPCTPSLLQLQDLPHEPYIEPELFFRLADRRSLEPRSRTGRQRCDRKFARDDTTGIVPYRSSRQSVFAADFHSWRRFAMSSTRCCSLPLSSTIRSAGSARR